MPRFLGKSGELNTFRAHLDDDPMALMECRNDGEKAMTSGNDDDVKIIDDTAMLTIVLKFVFDMTFSTVDFLIFLRVDQALQKPTILFCNEDKGFL